MKIGIGIDTGGTCTDAVAYDFETGTVLAKGKELTTREDLSVGIGRALDALPQELIREASLISLSTTLATNACVENKGGRAKLLISA
jgi:N-methylhydantoinase A/oxoprolinase/acetone carboxylase beta subunit